MIRLYLVRCVVFEKNSLTQKKMMILLIVLSERKQHIELCVVRCLLKMGKRGKNLVAKDQSLLSHLLLSRDVCSKSRNIVIRCVTCIISIENENSPSVLHSVIKLQSEKREYPKSLYSISTVSTLVLT